MVRKKIEFTCDWCGYNEYFPLEMYSIRSATIDLKKYGWVVLDKGTHLCSDECVIKFKEL